MPMCGFSAFVAQLLERMGLSDRVKDINVLEDATLRQGIKDYTQCPTIAQLYIKGEFVGGCDIVREMFESGELHQLQKDRGIPYREEEAQA